MKSYSRKTLSLSAWHLVCLAALLTPILASAQWPYPAPSTSRDSQRSALGQLCTQINWLQNGTRTAANYGAQGYGNVLERFQNVRASYGHFKQTLDPQQQAVAANGLAELDAGLDILQEAFANFEADVSAGRPMRSALNDMCQVLREGSQIWADHLNQVCSQSHLAGR